MIDATCATWMYAYLVSCYFEGGARVLNTSCNEKEVGGQRRPGCKHSSSMEGKSEKGFVFFPCARLAMAPGRRHFVDPH